MIEHQLDLFDGPASQAARDDALAQVTEHNELWMDQAVARVAKLPPMTGPFELWRKRLLDDGLEPPLHHNAWGALGRVCQERGLLVRTGRHVKMRAVRSHARETPELTTKRRDG